MEKKMKTSKMSPDLFKKKVARLRSVIINPRDRAIVEILYCTGARCCELPRILVEDVDFNEGIIWLRNKTGQKERVTYSTTSCVEQITNFLRYRIDGSPFLFINKYGHAINTPLVERILRKYSANAGLDTPINAKAFRDHIAYQLAENGASFYDIANILGLNPYSPIFNSI